MDKLKYFLMNDQEYCTTYDLTILELVEYFDYNQPLIVLEYNYLICNEQDWNKICIQNNDKIEIVTLVGGG